MSLLDDFARPCVLLEKSRTPDGAGGYVTIWTDGVEFANYQMLDTSMEARRAEKEGVTSVYSVLVQKPYQSIITTSSATRRPARRTASRPSQRTSKHRSPQASI